MWVNHDVFFDESTSLYSLPSPTPEDSKPIVGVEASAAGPLNEEDIGALEESLISFRLSGPNEKPSQNNQLDDESTSSGDSTV